jgi:glycosyltransferase involved in cell wall biosynthesis
MKLNLNCPINQTSYGYVSSYFMRGLSNLKWDIRHIPIGPNQPDSNFNLPVNTTIDRNAGCLRIWHQHDLFPFYGKGLQIGMPIFELESFSKIERHSLLNPDHLFVCSEWAKKVILNNLPRNEDEVHVIPLGFDPSIFYPKTLKHATTIFGNFGKFEVRKGHDVLVDIFNLAFSQDDDVALVMMPHNFFLNQEETDWWVNKYKSSKLGNKIELIGRLPTQIDVAHVMSQVDCGIFPSRAEGWNLEALELLAMGKHLIITDCTAHTEYCDDKNSMLVEMSSGYERAIDNKFFNGEHEWRSIGKNEIDQMVEHMRRIHRLNQEGNLGENKLGIESVQKYTWDSVSQMMSDKLCSLL